MRALGLALWVTGCATFHATERFSVQPADVPPEQVVAAASGAAERLGLRVERGRVAGALNDDMAFARDVELKSSKPGELEIVSSTRWGLGATSAAIAAGTSQLLESRPLTPRVTPRSMLLVVGLDLITPLAGGLVADAGDPFGRHWWHWVLPVGDVLAATMIGLALNEPQPHRGEDLLIGVLELVLVRVAAMALDSLQVMRRNDAVESGFDLSALPERSG